MFENTQFVALYFAGTIGINLLCAAFIGVARVREHRLQIKLLIFGCVSTALCQYFTWQYHISSNAEHALIFLKIHTSIVILCLPFYAKLFLLWTKYEVKRPYFIAFVAMCALFFLINLFSQYSLRFSGQVEFVEYLVFNNETVVRLDGDPNPYMLGFYIFVLLVQGGLAAVVYKAFKQSQFMLFSLLLSTLFVQAISGFMGSQMDAGYLQSIYLDGLAFTVLNCLSCLFIASSLEHKTSSLKAQVNKREELESVLLGLAKGTSSNNSDEFYVNMTHELQRLSQASFCFIFVLSESEPEVQVATKAALYKGKHIANFSLLAKAIPSELVDKAKQGMIIDNLEQYYKDLPVLARTTAKSWISAPMLNEAGEPEGSIVLLFDERHQINENLSQTLHIFASRAGSELQRDRVNSRLASLAYFDYQTKLPNMSSLYEVIEYCYQRNTQNHTQSGLIMFDLNRFTEVNRNFGFEYSELAIKTLGQRFKDYSNNEIFIARTGGDEFVCLIKDMEHDPASLMKLHWEAISSLVKRPIHVGSFVIRLSCNGGGVVFPEQTNSKMEVIRCAEIALASAKLDHGHALTLFDMSSLKAIDRKEKLIKMLEPAMRASLELYVVYQPKVDCKGQLLGCESLVRWNNPELGMISPDEFIVLAEESALVDELGIWMLQQVCKQIAEWHQAGVHMPARVAVNVSPYQIAQDHFVASVINTMHQYGVSASMLEIEITETLLLTNIEDCIDKLKQLRELGISVALDDFGTGYSSLQYLNELPLDVIKIDRSFVSNLHKKNTYELAKAIVSIGHHMDLKVVAEGAETAKQVDALSEIGCDILQGYFFARPMRAYELTRWAKQQKQITNTNTPA